MLRVRHVRFERVRYRRQKLLQVHASQSAIITRGIVRSSVSVKSVGHGKYGFCRRRMASTRNTLGTDEAHKREMQMLLSLPFKQKGSTDVDPF